MACDPTALQNDPQSTQQSLPLASVGSVSGKISSPDAEFYRKLTESEDLDLTHMKEYLKKSGCKICADNLQGKFRTIIRCVSFQNTLDVFIRITQDGIVSIGEPHMDKNEMNQVQNKDKLSSNQLIKGQFEFEINPTSKDAILALSPNSDPKKYPKKTAKLSFVGAGIFRVNGNKFVYLNGKQLINQVFKPLVLALAPPHTEFTDASQLSCKFREFICIHLCVY